MRHEVAAPHNMVAFKGPCSLQTCLETGLHVHPVCHICGALRYGNPFCRTCADYQLSLRPGDWFLAEVVEALQLLERQVALVPTRRIILSLGYKRHAVRVSLYDLSTAVRFKALFSVEIDSRLCSDFDPSFEGSRFLPGAFKPWLCWWEITSYRIMGTAYESAYIFLLFDSEDL